MLPVSHQGLGGGCIPSHPWSVYSRRPPVFKRVVPLRNAQYSGNSSNVKYACVRGRFKSEQGGFFFFFYSGWRRLMLPLRMGGGPAAVQIIFYRFE